MAKKKSSKRATSKKSPGPAGKADSQPAEANSSKAERTGDDKETPRRKAESQRSASPTRHNTRSAKRDVSDSDRQAFPVVGVGASAGGLRALRTMLEATPEEPGVAFVVIQHLDPTRKSFSPEILAKHTKMTVCEIADDSQIKPNRVYIIPPAKYLSVSAGKLQLSDPDHPRGARMAVDYFLRSLASDRHQCAVGVILSGTGADGTLGIKAIKAAGGLVIAQDPATAEHEGMPRSAINAGVVDHVLPFERIPDVLVRYARHPYVCEGPIIPAEADQEPAKGKAAESRTEGGFGALLAMLRAHTKHDFRNYKDNTLIRRMRRRMSLHHIDEYEQYLEYLLQHPLEIDLLAEDLLITVTDFFREPDAWEELRLAMRSVIENKEEDEPLRVWTPGCATGEESYSVAMLLLEELKRNQKNCPLNVFASDIDRRSLEYARIARYPKSIVADVSQQRLERFFTVTDGDDYYHVNKSLREVVVFADQNLIGDPPFSKLDLLCCRNLLIYLKPDVQEKIIALFHFALREGGVLFLGNAETIGQQTDLFETINKRWRIYRRVGPTRHDRVDIPIGDPRRRRDFDVQPDPPRRRETRLTHLAQRRLLDLLAPSAVLIDRKWRIKFICGDVDPYVTHRSGVPDDDLLNKARRGLRSKLRVAARRALSEGRTVSVTARVLRDAAYHPVGITVRVIHDREQDEDLALVMFEKLPVEERGPACSDKATDEGKAVPVPARRAGADDDLDDHDVIRQLEEELALTKDDLQATVEQLEASNEEFKASNEEIMSINEELQSTNEELETGKEELQSLNEELSTVNNQLAVKVDELETKHADLQNLLAATDVATICLGTDLAVRWFTPAAQQLIRLREADKGRPLADITHDFTDGDLVKLAEGVLAKLTPIEDEVSCRDDRVFIRRGTPYRTDEHRIGGVVITFIDITRRKQAEDAIAESKKLSDELIEAAQESMLVLEKNLRVVWANKSFYETFQVAREETEGRLVYELGNDQWDIPELRRMLDGVLPDNDSFDDYEVDLDFRTIGRKMLLLSARRTSHSGHILLTIQDVTELMNSNRILEDQISQRTAMLKMLQDITRAANESLTVDDAMRAAMKRIAAYDGWRYGHVWWRQDAGDVGLVSTDIWYVDDGSQQALECLEELQLLFEGRRVHEGEGIVGEVMSAGEPKWVDDIRRFGIDWQRGHADRLGLRAAIAFPIVSNNQVVAVMEFISDRSTSREQDFMDIMPDIGFQLGHVVERKRLEREVADSTEREQRRIGADIHDGLGQELTGLRYTAQTHWENLVPQSPDEAKTAARIVEWLTTVQRQLRDIVRRLVPVEVDEKGLVAALKGLAEQTAASQDLNCRFECGDRVVHLDSARATHLYRIAQEAVRNAVRHARATQVVVRLAQESDALVLRVADDGIGIQTTPGQSSGYGLRSMVYRAGLIGGRIDFRAGESGSGTTVTCVIPRWRGEQDS